MTPRVIAIPICQSILINTLRKNLVQYTKAITAEAVVHAGPFDLQSLAHDDPRVLEASRKVYAIALQRIYIVALTAGCVAAICTLGMEAKNVKHVQKAKREMIESQGGTWQMDVDSKTEPASGAA